jgi:site-specific DNA recombinase
MINPKIGLYARVSSVTQAKEKTIESQISAIIDYAESWGEKIDPSLYFIDNGVSGASLERPGLDLLRDRALEGELSKVYVLSPDRLSRKNAYQILLIEEMKRLGVEFCFTNRQIGDTPEDQMLLQMQGIVAEYEREKILERSRRGKLFAAKQGKVNALSGAPYGYYYQKSTESQDATYIIHPEESEVVKEAFQLYCRYDFSIGKIAKEFTNKAYLTRTGKTTWERSVIWGMLKNPAYKGQAAFRKTKVAKRTKKIKPVINGKKAKSREFSSATRRQEEEWIFIPVPAIIDEKTFEFAKNRLEKNKKLSPRNNKKYEYLLSSLLRCKNCGYAIYGKPTSNSKYKRLYYRCMGQDGFRWSTGRICKGHSVRVEVIDDLVWDSLKELMKNPAHILHEYENRLSENKRDHGLVIKKKHAQRKQLELERSRLIDLYQAGLVEKAEIGKKLKTIQSKMEHLGDEVKHLIREEEDNKRLIVVIESLKEFSATLQKKLDECDFEEKKKIVRLLVEEVEVDTIKDSINIKHIIPMDVQKSPLCLGSDDPALRCSSCPLRKCSILILRWRF